MAKNPVTFICASVHTLEYNLPPPRGRAARAAAAGVDPRVMVAYCAHIDPQHTALKHSPSISTQRRIHVNMVISRPARFTAGASRGAPRHTGCRPGAAGGGGGRGVQQGEGAGDISSTLPCTALPHGASP